MSAVTSTSPRNCTRSRRSSSDISRRARGLDANFVLGDAETLAFLEASVDAIVSVFGVIFAERAVAVAAEMARRLAPNGRIVLSAWVPGGALADQARLRRAAVAAAVGQAPGQSPDPAPFPWHDRDALAATFGPHGFSVEVHEEVVAFTAASASEYAEGEWQNHPLWVQARTVLEPLGRWQAVCDDTLRLFTDANEEPGAFRVSSRYVVAHMRRRDSTVPVP